MMRPLDHTSPAEADAAIRSLCDPDRLAPWLDQQGLEPGLPLIVERIAGGVSNEMFLLSRGAARWVLRRPAGVALPRAAGGLRREFRFLTALDQTGAPHPRAVVAGDDESVIGAPFYVMEQVAGWRPDQGEMASRMAAPEDRADVAHALIDALADLHLVDPIAVGLGDLGRLEDFHERQVRRWTTQLHSYEGREIPGFDEVGAWLDAHRPTTFVPAIMHGDYHQLNVILTEARPWRVAAILDWETATIGDPLVDLAGFLRNVSRPQGEGWPSAAVLVERYAERTGRVVSSLGYYTNLARMRLAVLLEGVHQRGLQDPTRTVSAQVADMVLQLINDARSDIDSPR
jgi:aminoglycoside phosphotransferase (APT) family kinase protein